MSKDIFSDNVIKIVPFIPSHLAKRWKPIETKTETYAAFIDSKTSMTVLSSIETMTTGKDYIHLDIFKNLRRPDWEEVNTAKNAFIGKDKMAIIPLFDESIERNSTSIHVWSMIDE